MGRQSRFHIKSPQKASNLALSAPHRLLVIALRRQALEGISTIDELHDSEMRHIRIKSEFLDRPVVASGTYRGLKVNMDKPATAGSLSEYIRLRGQKLGYKHTITIYSFRRRAGTDFSKAFGNSWATTLRR